MRYRIRFRSHAKEELDRAKQQYGNDFSHQLDEWLADIADSASRRDRSKSIDFIALLEEGAMAAGNPTRWGLAWRRWCEATALEKARALIALLKTRCPPWEIRATSKWFTGILAAFDCEAHVYFEIDHVEQVVVFTKFAGLPGEDC